MPKHICMAQMRLQRCDVTVVAHAHRAACSDVTVDGTNVGLGCEMHMYIYISLTRNTHICVHVGIGWENKGDLL